ncbi:uncharacterized protein EI97DRAFT_502664 [Westerdykella ornata]|uniref:Uncharacterized protein n=1 Tax=Westerdykella ornata TaxID=318751 RepID=A0A6A6JEA7_WESOR|nr:uncharacterized protein EI97DRAFT_502664 [Westerdykella ornata]KAF2274554.1 hypothetical protein EI97DRAFT_502664 [Westerdykella ornata]
MPRFLRGSPAETVRTAAGHRLMDWEGFLTITHKEAKDLVQEEPSTNWRRLPASKKQTVFRRVNAKLAAEGIPQVEEDVLIWRMSQAIRAARKAVNREAETAVLNSNTAAGTRPFDPVRDSLAMQSSRVLCPHSGDS